MTFARSAHGHVDPRENTFLALVSDAFGGHGGIAKYNRDLLGSLMRFDGGSSVVALPRAASLDVAGVPSAMHYETASLGGKSKYLRAFLRQLVRTPKAGLVICGHINLLSLSLVASRRYGAPLVLIAHGIEAWKEPENPLRKRMLAEVDLIVAVSETTRKRLAAWSRIPLDRIRVVPNSVDLSAFTPGPKSTSFLEKHALAGKRVVLTFGRLEAKERYKGFDEMLEVMPRLLSTHPDLVYVIAGDGSDRGRLEAKAATLGISRHVRFTGRVPEADKVALYRTADAYAMPSRGEGFGIVLLEALACGVPCVASAVDGSREALRDGELGAVVDPDDPNEIERAVLAALARPTGVVPPGLGTFSLDMFEQRVHRVVRDILSGAQAYGATRSGRHAVPSAPVAEHDERPQT